MHKIFLIIRREYLTRVRKRVFIITTLLTPIGFSLIFIIPLLLSQFSSDHKTIVVADETGIFKNQLKDKDNISFKYSDEPFDHLKKTYKESDYSGILYVPANYEMYTNANPVEYYSDEQIGISGQSTIADELTDIVTKIKLSKKNISPDEVKELSKDVSLKITIGGAAGEKEGNAAIATALGYIMGFFLYIIMLTYGMMVMRGVMEEKINRIAEVIISSVKPFQLMMGKIIGIGLVGLTQFALWIVLMVAIWSGLQFGYKSQLEKAQKAQVEQRAQMQQMNPAAKQMQPQMGGWDIFGKANAGVQNLSVVSLIIEFIIYFIGGFILYASLFAAIGSATGDEPDQAQPLSFLATLPIIISLFIMINTLQHPNSGLAVFASIFPLTSPIVMCARLPFEPPLWQIASSMIALVLGFLFTVWLAGKIYRTGILLYGKKVTLKELGKWIMYKN